MDFMGGVKNPAKCGVVGWVVFGYQKPWFGPESASEPFPRG